MSQDDLPAPGEEEPVPLLLRVTLDLAHAFYAWLGLVVIGFIAFVTIPMENHTEQGLGMVVGIPVVFLSMLIGLGALILSAVHWREARVYLLFALFAVPVGCGVVHGMLPLETQPNVEASFLIASGLAGAVLLGLCIQWFFSAKRRGMRGPAPDPPRPKPPAQERAW